MLDKVTKNECLYALQEGGLDLKEANTIYDYFVNEAGVNFLMLEFICAVQEEDPTRFKSVIAEIEEENENV